MVLHVAPHPDDEALGCPAALLHLRDRGWKVVSMFVGLGDAADHARRRAEAVEASERAGFEPDFMDPPCDLGLGADLSGAATRVADEVAALAAVQRASVVVSPSPHDVHHGHEAVGRGVQLAMAALSDTVRWWMWGLWGDLPAPNVFYAFDETMLERALHVLSAYDGELARNDYRRYLRARAVATAVTGSERVFGFGSAARLHAPLRGGAHRGEEVRAPVPGLGAPRPRRGSRRARRLPVGSHRLGRSPQRPRAPGPRPGTLTRPSGRTRPGPPRIPGFVGSRPTR